MATNNFKLFDENKANMMGDTEYGVNPQRLNGVQTGVASSELNNKFAYQMSLVAYSIAQMMNANGIDANDTQAVSAFVNGLSSTVMQKVLDKATEEEVIKGIVDNKYITPKTGHALSTTAVVNVYADIGSTVTMSRPGLTLVEVVNSNGYAVLNPDKLGDWTIVYTFGGNQITKSYTLQSISIVDIYPEVSNVLENASWDDIDSISKLGIASKIWKIGDIKSISFDGVNYVSQIIGFDHDDLSDKSNVKTKAGITFQLRDCLNDQYTMLNTPPYVNNWGTSYMRTTLMQTFLGKLPADLSRVIKLVDKITSKGSKSSLLETTQDKLFLLSEVEIFGNIQYSYLGEGEQYEYYVSGSKIKRVKGANSSWAQRSPYKDSNETFCIVSSYGAPGTGSGQFGVPFAFCV